MAKRGSAGRVQRRAASYERQRQEHEALASHRALERERQAAKRHAADALSALEAKWGTRADALNRLGQLSQALDRIRVEQNAALVERDELIAGLRDVGESWNALAARTGLSRQGLSKRALPS